MKTEQQDIRLHIQDRLCDLLVYLIGGKSKQTEDTEKVKLDENPTKEDSSYSMIRRTPSNQVHR